MKTGTKKSNVLLVLWALLVLGVTIFAIYVSAHPELTWRGTIKNEAGDEEESISIKLSEIQDDANNSSSMWELLCKMLPEHVIFKDSKGRFTSERVNAELALNTYDWSSLAGTRKGMDVSYYQGAIDWSKVKQSGIEYAIIRLGYRGYAQGVFSEDKKFEANITGALSNDIPAGVYFVTKAITVDEGIEEANYVLERIKPYNVTWPVVIDIEPASSINDRTNELTAPQRTDIILAFCDTIKEAGYTPMIYGGVGTFMNYLEFERLEGVEKWFAQYFNQPYLRYEFGIWQATDKGEVLGIRGNVDINYSLKDYGAKE